MKRTAPLLALLVLTGCAPAQPAPPTPSPSVDVTTTVAVTPSTPPSPSVDVTTAVAVTPTPPVLEIPDVTPEELARVTFVDGVLRETEKPASPVAGVTYGMEAACLGPGTLEPELLVNGVRVSNLQSLGCSTEQPSTLTDATIPALKPTDKVSVRVAGVTAGQTFYVRVVPEIPTEG